MNGKRTADDPLNIEGSGYNYGDPVSVLYDGGEVSGVVETIHAAGKKIDVRILQSGHKKNGAIITFEPDAVEPADSSEKTSTISLTESGALAEQIGKLNDRIDVLAIETTPSALSALAIRMDKIESDGRSIMAAIGALQTRIGAIEATLIQKAEPAGNWE